MRTYRKYTDDEFILFVKDSISIAEVLRKLNLRPAGGNYASIKRLLNKLSPDTSHWTGQAWSKNKQLKDWRFTIGTGDFVPALFSKTSHDILDSFYRLHCNLEEAIKLIESLIERDIYPRPREHPYDLPFSLSPNHPRYRAIFYKFEAALACGRSCQDKIRRLREAKM